MRLRLVFLSALAALLVAATALARSPSERKAMARARADVTRQLRYVRLPHGARKVSTDPSYHGLHLEGKFCLPKYTAWRHEFWRVPRTPESVSTWLQKHPPLHNLGYDLTGMPDGKETVWDMTVPFKSHKRVLGQTIDIQLGYAQGGGTAVRVDSEAFVKPPPHTKNPCPAPSSY